MRVVTASDQESASNYAMKGFAIGIAQWATVGIFASGLLYAFAPWYRRTQTVNKFYIVMCFGLGGGAYKSDRYMVNYERRGRAEMLDAETRRRYDLIYGGKSDEQEEAKKVSAST
ncbi:hypothetical protein BCR42DRAFT_456852 [Absidia repens]|uniref:Uncharacterized protein n=1 Tax=Absidia repens TaxID=90262 RepID=A0A1X2HYV3_9FUNG|nr:hypothetical protein BCR42DRAFT_456852 [Absidia repens]